ncbi:hypothetical protein DYB36_001383 [Aphanomyces astaci]|uniref:USP domain-containing protein n=1 Tax=Aphanomyces astaci TaxID=112090 RepID=A0A397B5D3_APHAT|nr:hypothetical protein DYB36_001383 [Aphanomyces astaci]
MDQILQGVLLSDKSDDEKKLCIDHILSCSLSREQHQSISGICWSLWPEGSTPALASVLVHALGQLPNQFIVCARRYLNNPATPEDDACFRWMQMETRHAEWIPVIKVLFLFLSMRPAQTLGRVVAVFQHCPCVPFSSFLVVKDLYLNTEKLANVLIKCGRLPMVGHTGAWLKQLLLLLVHGEQWPVLLTGGNDVILSVAEQLQSADTVHGSLVVLETIFLGFQENADVFLAFFPHFYDRVAPWVTTPPSALPHSTLVYLHEFLQGLLFAFPGHPFRATLAAEFQTSRQQDASEFLHYVWDHVTARRDPAAAWKDSVFTGKYARHITCSRCHAVSTTTEEFLDIPVPVPTAAAIGPPLPLLTLLRAQFATESLTGVREKVCTPVACTTSLHLPVHNNVDVGLPSNLGGDHVIDDDHVTYDLYAATIHAGSRADHGHYYTFARHEERWVLLNDSRVTSVDEGLVHHTLMQSTTDTPYILWYRRRNASTIGTWNN